PDEKHQRRPSQRVQRRSLAKHKRGESGKRKHQRRAKNRSLSTHCERVGPNDSRRRHKLNQPALTQSSHHEKHNSADEADVKTTDHENVKSSTFAKTLGRITRKVVVITQQGRVEHARSFSRESRIDLSLEPFSPLVKQ